LAMGLLAGCGGAADGEEPSQLSTREDGLEYCEGFSDVTYYSDATYTVQVGHGDCSCGHTLRISGRKSEYAIYNYGDFC